MARLHRPLLAFAASILLVLPQIGRSATLIDSVAALKACLEGGGAGATVSCAMDEGTYSLGTGLSLSLTAARAVLVCPFGPAGTVFTMEHSGVAIGKASGGTLEIENCAIRDVGSASGTIAVDQVTALRRVSIESFDDVGDVGFRGAMGVILDSSIAATRPVDASTGTGGDFSIQRSKFVGKGTAAQRDWCFFGYDSAAGNPQVVLAANKWERCKGFQVRTEGTWHMIDDEGFLLGHGSDPNDAIFFGSANDFKVRMRARGNATQGWNSMGNLLIYWRGLNGNSNDFTNFDFELYDADACPALGAHGAGPSDTRPIIDWDGDDVGGQAFPTFHRFRLAIRSDTIVAAAPLRVGCDRPSPFGATLLAGWANSLDGHLTQGLYEDSLWRVEIKDGIPQKLLANTGQMAPPRSCDWNLEAPTVAQDGHHQCRIPTGARLSKVSCSTTHGEVVVNLYERSPTAPNTGSTEMLAADLICDTAGDEVDCNLVQANLYDCSSVFADDFLEEGSLLTLGVRGVSSPGHLRVHTEWY